MTDNGHYVYKKGDRYYVVGKRGSEWLVEVYEGGCDC